MGVLQIHCIGTFIDWAYGLTATKRLRPNYLRHSQRPETLSEISEIVLKEVYYA